MSIDIIRFKELMKRRHLLPPPGGDTAVATVAEMAKISFDSNVADCSGIASLSRGLVLQRGCRTTHATDQPELTLKNFFNAARDAEVIQRRHKLSADLDPSPDQPRFSQALFVDYHNISNADETSADQALKYYEKYRKRLSTVAGICVLSVGLSKPRSEDPHSDETELEQRLTLDGYVSSNRSPVMASDFYRSAYRNFLKQIDSGFSEDVCSFFLENPTTISFWESRAVSKNQ